MGTAIFARGFWGAGAGGWGLELSSGLTSSGRSRRSEPLDEGGVVSGAGGVSGVSGISTVSREGRTVTGGETGGGVVVTGIGEETAGRGLFSKK